MMLQTLFLAIYILQSVVFVGAFYLLSVRYRNIRDSLRTQDKRLCAQRNSIHDLQRSTDGLATAKKKLRKKQQDGFNGLFAQIGEVHIRLKRCETALGIHEARGENVRAENLRKRQQAQGAGSPLPVTYTPPRATQVTKKN